MFSTVITGLCVVKPWDCWKRPVAMAVSAHPAKKQCTLLKEQGAALATAGEADVAHCVDCPRCAACKVYSLQAVSSSAVAKEEPLCLALSSLGYAWLNHGTVGKDLSRWQFANATSYILAACTPIASSTAAALSF